MPISDQLLTDYARRLFDAGFEIDEPLSNNPYFRYSRIVDGRECYGLVQQESLRLAGYSHTMPIKPSRQHGSSMVVPQVSDGWDNLTIKNAELVASPRNRNPWVGEHENYVPPTRSSLYRRWKR